MFNKLNDVILKSKVEKDLKNMDAKNKKNIFEMNLNELQCIIEHSNDYTPGIIEIAKERIAILEETEKKAECEDNSAKILLQSQKNIEYYLKTINKRLNGIAFILWACFICSVIYAIIYAVTV